MEHQKPDTNSDEIEIGQLFSKIGVFFGNVWMGFIRFLALIRRLPLENKSVFLIMIASGLVIGYLYADLLRKKFFETSMILSSQYLNKRVVDNTIEKLNLLANEKDRTGLANILHISDSLASNILEFQAKPFVKETDLIELEVLKEQLRNAQIESKNKDVISYVIQRIEIENRHAFEITVRVYNPGVILELEEAVVKYFRNNEYIKRRIDITKTNLISKKKKLESDLQKLDSLKEIIYSNYKSMAEQSRQGSNNVILTDKAVTDPVQIYKQDIDVYDELEAAVREIYLQTDFEVVTHFTQFSEPASASKGSILVTAALIAFILSYLAIALASFNRYLSQIK